MRASSSVASSGDTAPPRLYFIPFPTPGHALPMSDLARLFASRGADATLVLTHANAARLGGPVARAAAAGLCIRIHALTMPAEAAGLTGGHESADDLLNRELAGPFAIAVDLLAPLFTDLLRRHPADAVVFDGVLPWAATAAPELGIPRYAFTGTGCFALSVQRSLLLHSPQNGVASDTEPFLVPGLPDAVRLTRSRLAEATLPGADSREFLNRMFDVERATAGWVVNSFADLEQRYIEHYEKVTGKPVFAVGPVCLVNGDGDDTLERGRGGEAAAAAEAARVLKWLDTKPARSVVYVCFGSLTRFPLEQVSELGMGLADSGANFVWVVGDKNVPPLPDIDAAAPGRGLVVRGWAPQVAVLRHAAVGAFVTHCGWGAVTEAAAAGVPVLAWPVFAEQFYNEALVVGLAGTGVGMGADRGYVWGGEALGGVVVGREAVAERVRGALADEALRRRAGEIGGRARRAVEAGGSSYEAVGALLEDVLRPGRRSHDGAGAGASGRDTTRGQASVSTHYASEGV
ncbi:UDP-glucose flavonoid 3-O-glucosyltransferase 7-like [Panicum miliaceum]|uniref:Glycosyltransferase n=1 Tax=Panicum miliaceum TaxID=4540 RepID=A0A3L6S7F8_PANMI|nr:UDP-glucose flavonoid 3-O-glucosyltransferase 7-like [Panicum miliaceum]